MTYVENAPGVRAQKLADSFEGYNTGSLPPRLEAAGLSKIFGQRKFALATQDGCARAREPNDRSSLGGRRNGRGSGA